ncbi:MAG: PhzF family phenazine biosynthesis isomerase, partial [Propionicimonas sp.]
EVGFSETAFLAARVPREFAVRYFSPGAEVPFCGHATIAAAAVLAERSGTGTFWFDTPVGQVPIETERSAGKVSATFTSVEPAVREPDPATADELLDLLGMSEADLDPALPLREAFAGNWHPVVALARQDRFDGFGFDPAAVRELMDRRGWAGTVTVVHRLGPEAFEARNLFPVGTITEDPATGSAAASLGGYLRALGVAPARFEIRQGRHVGAPSRLVVSVPPTGGIRVSGTVRTIAPAP